MVRGNGLFDTLLQTAGRAVGKLTSAAPQVAEKLLASGKAAVVPAAQSAGHAAGTSIADRATKLLSNLTVSKEEATLPSIAGLTPAAQKAAVGAVQKRAEALLARFGDATGTAGTAANVSNLIYGQGLRLYPY